MTNGNPGNYADQAAFKAFMDSCYTDNAEADQIILDAITKLNESTDQDTIKAAVQEIITALPDVESGMATCTEQTANIQNVVAYFNYVKTMNPDQRFTMALKNLKNHYAEVSADMKAVTDAWNNSDYFNLGLNSEKTAITVIPWAPAVDLPETLPTNIKDLITGLVSGWIWEQTNGNPGNYADQAAFQAYMSSCYTDNPDSDAIINNAIITIDANKGDQELIKA